MDVTGTIDTTDPSATHGEVRRIYEALFGHGLSSEVERTFEDIVRLFSGRYPGYQACDTVYHDLEHTMQAYLAAARIFDGLVRTDRSRVSAEFVSLGLIAALGHDAGFIKAVGDDGGHGGKYTLTHVQRSKQFIGRYLAGQEFSTARVRSVCNAIECTGLSVDVAGIGFSSAEERDTGCVVGSADYLGQMSDPLYVEKLPGLYDEYREASVPGYESAADLLDKTPAFFDYFVMRRLNEDYGGVYRFAEAHFGGPDLYIEAIKRNVNHLRDAGRSQPAS